MPPKIVLPAGAPQPNWLQQRTRGVGGSEISVVMGRSPYKTAYELFVDKTTQQWADNKLAGNPAIEWGNRLESAVATAFEEQTGLLVQIPEGLYASETHPFALASPDRLVDPDGVLEIKTTGAHNGHQWSEGILGMSGKAPIYYVDQLNWYLGVLERTQGWLAALIGGQQFVIVKTSFDRDLFSQQLTAAQEFWKHVTDGVPPELPNDHRNTADLLTLLERPTTEEPKLLDDSGVRHCDEILRIKAEIKEKETVLLGHQNALRKLLGSHEVGITETGEVRATWRPYQQRRIDGEKLRAEYPDIAMLVETETEMRPLLVKK